MGAFHFIAKTGDNFAQSIARSRTCFLRGGFGVPTTVENDAFILDYYGKLNGEVHNFIAMRDGGFIFSVGTFLYRSAIGKKALKLILEEPHFDTAVQDAHGHFAVMMYRNGVMILVRDPMGSQEVYLSRDESCVSSSFLAAAYACSGQTVSPQEAYEYVFSGCVLGTATPFVEVRRLGLFEQIKFDVGLTTLCRRRNITGVAALETRTTLIERNSANLLRYTGILANIFNNNIQLSQSGGYDSRLLLALFRNHGIAPRLFVYGRAGDPDVEIPREISLNESLGFQHIDKSMLVTVPPNEYPRTVNNNFYCEDGLESGGIFHSGAELIERRRRSSGNALHVNGGGGEVFRNFFNLLDRGVTVQQFVWMFYSRSDPSSCSPAFNRVSYELAIAAKVADLLHLKGDRLTRQEVECLYPYFRCRSWFGRENSINSRYGYSVLPFFDYAIVREALQIPVRFKYFGNFESALIRAVDPRLATYRSIYGYNFNGDAPPLSTAEMIATYLRPLRLRRNMFWLKAAWQRRQQPTKYLDSGYLSQVIDLRFPYMSRFFDVEKIVSNLQFARICTLEYLYAQFAARQNLD